MIVTSFALGIAVGFIFFEIFGLTAGGVIVPGYLALYMHEPLSILLTIFISFITFHFVMFLSRYLVIFGRRRFLLMVLCGFLIRSIFDFSHIFQTNTELELQVIGYIIPGLIANEFARQGIVRTISAIVTVSIFVYFILQVIYF